MHEYTDLRLLKENDIFLVPACILLLLMLVYPIRKKYRNTPLEKYFMPALFLRFFFVFVYASIIQFYYGYGDTSLYYVGVQDMHNALNTDFSIWKDLYLKLDLKSDNPIYSYFMYDNGAYTHLYMANTSNYMVPRFALPFSMIFANSYLCICFCLSLYSFAGCWRIFKMFTEMYPKLHKKFAIGILFLPSILFWGGSLLKDSICMGSMGLALYAAYSIVFKQRKIFASSVILVITCFLLSQIKPYILLCMVPAFMLWIFLQFKNKIEDRTLRRIAGVLFALLAAGAGFYALQAITQSEMLSQYSSEKLLQTVQGIQGSFTTPEGSGSNFSVGQVSDSPGNLALLFPLGVVATFYRPFLWESGSPLMLISGLEAFGFLYLTYLAFRRIGFKRFFSLLMSDSTAVFCLVFSLMFAGIVGVTTTNFGALARYKIPCLSFYLFMLFIVMDKSGKFSPNIIFSKKFF